MFLLTIFKSESERARKARQKSPHSDGAKHDVRKFPSCHQALYKACHLHLWPIEFVNFVCLFVFS
jgi:hypothetical protein